MLGKDFNRHHLDVYLLTTHFSAFDIFSVSFFTCHFTSKEVNLKVFLSVFFFFFFFFFLTVKPFVITYYTPIVLFYLLIWK